MVQYITEFCIVCSDVSVASVFHTFYIVFWYCFPAFSEGFSLYNVGHQNSTLFSVEVLLGGFPNYQNQSPHNTELDSISSLMFLIFFVLKILLVWYNLKHVSMHNGSSHQSHMYRVDLRTLFCLHTKHCFLTLFFPADGIFFKKCLTDLFSMFYKFQTIIN